MVEYPMEAANKDCTETEEIMLNAYLCRLLSQRHQLLDPMYLVLLRSVWALMHQATNPREIKLVSTQDPFLPSSFFLYYSLLNTCTCIWGRISFYLLWGEAHLVFDYLYFCFLLLFGLCFFKLCFICYCEALSYVYLFVIIEIDFDPYEFFFISHKLPPPLLCTWSVVILRQL